jgi:chemotaxis protein MotB
MSVYDPYSSTGDDGLTARKPPPPSTAWMLTVADLFSLMLTFFVLLYSMSVIQKAEFDKIAQSLMQRLNVVVDEETPMTLDESWQIPRASYEYARGLDYLNSVMSDRFSEAENVDGMVITRGEGRLTLSLTSDTMFRPGSATLEPQAAQTIEQVGIFLSTIGNAITIEGHTDPRPINTDAFPSNWELSMARAASVAEALHKAGYLHAFEVSGLGSSRYGELKNLTPQKRDELARRVDIIVRETVAKNGANR